MIILAFQDIHLYRTQVTKDKLSENEIQGAKNKILGQYALGKQTNSEIAQVFGWYESLGLGIEFDAAFQDAKLNRN